MQKRRNTFGPNHFFRVSVFSHIGVIFQKSSTFKKPSNLWWPSKETSVLPQKQTRKIINKKNLTTEKICRLENIEHKSMKQVSYSGKYSLSASQSHLQFSFVVGDAFSPRFFT